jgi:hypothetical protein
LESQAERTAEREKAVEKAFLDGVAALDRRRSSPPEREIELEVLRKRWEEDRLRSPWTEAYHAWKDVYDLYSPPETRWSRRARLMAPAARQKWREEWTARGLPFAESLLDLEPGEDGGYRLLVSTRDGREASEMLNVLVTVDIRILVPEDRFWEASQALLPLVGIDEN